MPSDTDKIAEVTRAIDNICRGLPDTRQNSSSASNNDNNWKFTEKANPTTKGLAYSAQYGNNSFRIGPTLTSPVKPDFFKSKDPSLTINKNAAISTTLNNRHHVDYSYTPTGREHSVYYKYQPDADSCNIL